jgi:hypothetical protein
MSDTVAHLIVWSLTAYAGLGLAFALVFVSGAVTRVDEEAHGAPLGFRLLILPGTIALWPLFLFRWLRGVHEPPVETNPHREQARTQEQ